MYHHIIENYLFVKLTQLKTCRIVGTLFEFSIDIFIFNNLLLNYYLSIALLIDDQK